MTNSKRILLLIIIMIVIASGVTVISLVTLYKTSFEQQRERLVETAQSQACMLEAVARFDAQYSTDDIPGGSSEATLSQIRDAHEHFKGFGETGEFTLAKRESNSIVFLLSHRHDDLENPEPVSFSSELAEPMRRALSGESGTVIGLDYRGVRVLAAYEPVKELNLGIVAKIDLSEIREPFINTGLLAGGGTLVLIIFGILLFQRIGNPLIKSIEESEKKYRTLFDSASDAIFIHDMGNQFLEVNQIACERLGYSHDELISMTVKDIDSPESYKLTPQLLEKFMKDGHITTEALHVTKDGKNIQVEINARKIDYEGKQAVLSIARDITKRKQAEEKLHESETRLNEAQKLAHIGSYQFENPDGKVIWSKETFNIVGMNPQHGEPTFKEFMQIVHPDDRFKVLRKVNQAFKKSKSYDFEYRIINKNGVIKHIHSIGTPLLDENGVSVKIFGTMMDITERKQAEVALLREATFVTLLQRVAVTANEASTIEDAMQVCLDEVCILTEWPVGHVYMPPDNGTGELVPTELWHIDDPEKFRTFREVTDRTTFKPGIGLPGRILTGRQPAWIIDVNKDTNFPRAELMENLGVKAAFGFPVLLGTEVVAVLEFFASTEAEPDEKLLEVMANIGKQLGRVVERTRAEEALQASEQRFRSFVENANNIVFELSPDGVFTYVSPNWTDNFGHEVSEVQGHPFAPFVHPDDVPACVAFLQQVLSTGENKSGVEYRVLHKDGSLSWHASSGAPLYDVNGEVRAFLGIASDITERKQAEEALLESEKRFRELVDLLPQSVYEIDLEGNFTFSNRFGIESTGYTENEIEKGVNTFQLFVPEDRERVQQNFRKILRGEEFDDHEYTILRKDGSTYPSLIYSNAIIRDNKPVGIRGIVLDITERKNAEDELLKHFHIIEQSPVSIVITDTNGDIEYVNPRFTRVTGYTFEESIGQNPRLMKSGEQPLERYKEMWSMITSGKEWKGEFHNKKKNGELFWEFASISPIINSEGIVTNFVAVKEDITKRKMAEEALKEAHGELEIRVQERTAELAKANIVLNAINTVFKETLECETEEELSHYCLGMAEELTGSKYGFIGELNQSGRLDKIVWRGIEFEASKIKESEISFLGKNTELRGIWGKLIKDKKSLIVNNFASHPDSVGTPEGHPSITSVMGIPLKRAGKIIGIIALANKESGYDVDDLEVMETLSVAIVEARDRKRAEGALRVSEELFRDFFDNAPIGFHIFGPDKYITDVNQAELDMIGYSRVEIVNKKWEDFVIPEERKAFKKHWNDINKYGLVKNQEYTLIHKDGHRLSVLINASARFDNKGNLISTRGSVFNITEQKKADKKIIELAKYPEENPLPVLRVSKNGTMLYTNKAGEPLLDAFKCKIDQPLPDNLRKIIMNTFDSGSVESEIEVGDNTFSLMYSPVMEADYVNIYGLDITERKRAKKKIEEYSKNLEGMVEERTKDLNLALYDAETAMDKIDGILKSVSDGLIVTDIHNKILLMNHTAEELLDVHFNEVIDRPIDIAIKEMSLREKLLAALTKKINGYQFDFELPGDDPKYPRFMRARISVIHDREDKYTGIITIFNDVTQEREVDRIKTEFLSMAAHELRTPLTSIQGFAEILQTREDLNDEEKKRFLSYINNQSVNLAEIVNDLLDISRIESGQKYTINKEVCDAGETIKNIIPYFQETSTKHKFEVVLPDKSMKLYVDEEKMEQVLKNLLSNAVKYFPEGGVIRVTGEMFKDYYQVSIEDQGMGMTTEQVEKIFDKFYRADASNTAISGTGLGMSIVKYLVEAHGGKVFVKSELGNGTTVRFTIPLDKTRKVKNVKKSKNTQKDNDSRR